jgi:multiple sugar transport system permease protein
MSAPSERRLALLLLAPALLALAAITLYPVIRVLGLSLERRVPVFGIERFVGLRHYAFLARDEGFWSAVRVTVTFTAVSVALEVLLGVALALALRAQRRGRFLGLALLLLPWCLPGVVTARTWEWLYHPTAGLVNRLAVALGAGGVNWLGDPATALPALIAVDVWRTTPFLALFAYARLTTIPAAVYEAAAVDGAGRWTTLRAITLPLLTPILLVAGLFRTLDALRVFDLVFVLTGGGPGGTTETLTIQAYRNLFQTLQLGLGAAVAVVVFGLVAAVAGLYLTTLERTETRR